MRNALHAVEMCLVIVTLAALAGSGCTKSSTAPSETPAANRPPAAGSIGVSPTGLGMAGVTSFTLTAQGAQDPDGNALTYNWTFGDGSSGSGSAVQHTYEGAGTFTVELRVSDGQESVAAPSVAVSVGPKLSGLWKQVQTNAGFPRLNVNQDGAQLTGTYTPNVLVSGSFLDYQGSGTVDTLAYPTAIHFTVPDTPCRAAQCAFGALFRHTIEGQITATGTRIDGTVTSVTTTSQGTQLPAQITPISLAR